MPNRNKLAIAAIVAAVAIALIWLRAIQGAGFSVVQGEERTFEPRAAPSTTSSDEQPLDAPPDRTATEAATPAIPRTLSCAGRVVDEHRFPIEAALVSLFLPGLGRFDAATGADGGFALELPRRATRAGTGGVYVTDGERAAVRGCSATESERFELGTLALEAAQALTVRVRRAGHPAAGASVRLYATQQRWPLFVHRTDDAGRALFPPLPRGPVFVEAGASGVAGRASLFLPRTGGAELLVDLQPTRTIELLATGSPDGTPLAGAVFTVRERVHDASALVPFEIEVPPSDDNGRSRIVDLPATGSFAVTAGAAGFVTAEALDVLDDTHELAFTLAPGADPEPELESAPTLGPASDEDAPAVLTLTLRLRVDGQPGLPPDYRLDGPPGLRLLGEDPLTGELAVAFPDDAPASMQSIRLDARGFLPVELAAAGQAGPVADVELQRVCELVGHVVLPAVGQAVIVAERRDRDSWREVDEPAGGLRAPNGPEGTFCFTRLAAGTYRIHDARTQRSSNELVLTPGGRGEAFLDLGGMQWVEGRVELPSGVDARRVRILDLDPSGATQLCGALPAGSVPRADGSFELLHPCDRVLILRPWHPYLAPQGAVELRGGAAGVVLRLVPADDVLLPLHTVWRDVQDETGVRVLVFDDEPAGQPQACAHAALEDGAARFGGAGRGRRTLWIDLGGTYAPAVLRGVELGAGTTRLDEPRFSTGSEIRVRAPGAARLPPLRITALRLEEPSYTRTIETDGGPEAVLAGLGPGTFAVRIEPRAAPDLALERTLTLDGARIVELELPPPR